MPGDLISKWLEKFLLWKRLRGMRLDRAVIPENALDSKVQDHSTRHLGRVPS